MLQVRCQSILTAIGATYVCRQGKICNRAVARCARTIKQSVMPLLDYDIHPWKH